MNANELADYLDNSVEAMIMSEQTHIDQAAIMLRQQQAEIEALRNQLWELKSEPWGFDRHPIKEAKYGITTKWDGITTYHETTEPIGKAQEK